MYSLIICVYLWDYFGILVQIEDLWTCWNMLEFLVADAILCAFQVGFQARGCLSLFNKKRIRRELDMKLE